MFEIGNSLREARLRRGIEIVQVEQATKIRGKYLRALEEERFEQLPAETYIKGFLRTYADYLGLDGQLYVDEYNSRFAAGVDEPDQRPRRAPIRRETRNRRLERTVVLAVLAAVAITTVVVIAAWQTSGKGAKAPAAHRTTHRKAVTRPPAAYLTIKAVSGPSYVTVHRNGPTGAILFAGTIGVGDPQDFDGKHFWLDVSSPENLVIKVAGKRVTMPGMEPQVLTVTAGGWHLG